MYQTPYFQRPGGTHGADDQHHPSQKSKRPGESPVRYRLLSNLRVQHDVKMRNRLTSATDAPPIPAPQDASPVDNPLRFRKY
jgi:hypothetical protein